MRSRSPPWLERKATTLKLSVVSRELLDVLAERHALEVGLCADILLRAVMKLDPDELIEDQLGLDQVTVEDWQATNGAA